jgi:hypothetical protein
MTNGQKVWLVRLRWAGWCLLASVPGHIALFFVRSSCPCTVGGIDTDRITLIASIGTWAVVGLWTGPWVHGSTDHVEARKRATAVALLPVNIMAAGVSTFMVLDAAPLSALEILQGLMAIFGAFTLLHGLAFPCLVFAARRGIGRPTVTDSGRAVVASAG